MARVLIDANIFLELELKQSKFAECKEFLKRVSQGDIQATTTDFILDGIALVMEDRGSPPEDIRKFFASLTLYEGLSLYALDLKDRIIATEEMARTDSDFDDATSLAAMKRLGINRVVSYDRDFNKVRGITRLEPKSLIR